MFKRDARFKLLILVVPTIHLHALLPCRAIFPHGLVTENRPTILKKNQRQQNESRGHVDPVLLVPLAVDHTQLLRSSSNNLCFANCEITSSVPPAQRGNNRVSITFDCLPFIPNNKARRVKFTTLRWNETRIKRWSSS